MDLSWKKFHRGAATTFISALVPKTIFNAVKTKYKSTKGEFRRFAIATDELSALSIDWNGNSIYVQSAAVIVDLGVFSSLDSSFISINSIYVK